MKFSICIGLCFLVMARCSAPAGETAVVTLKGFCDSELKCAGIDVRNTTTVHIKATGGGGDYGWSYKSDKMFAYAWIINADTRDLVWKMDVKNTSRVQDERVFDGTITLNPGSYEVYFTAYAFAYHTAFTHLNMNVDHRQNPLFSAGPRKTGFFSWFSDWWSDDIARDWEERCKKWGVDLYVDESIAGQLGTFTPPKEAPATVVKATGLGDHELVRRGFSLSAPTTLMVYAIGEVRDSREPSDWGWIVNVRERNRKWEMTGNLTWAGGSRKNQKSSATVTLEKGEYVLYFVTDGSHSTADWNEEPPYDPLNWGVAISVTDEKDRTNFRTFDYTEDQNVIVALTKVKDNDYRSDGFTLKEDTRVRIYAFGERSNSRRQMADYGTILDAKTRAKIWAMDVDRTLPAGGASKNRYCDEVITLPRGSYIVTYTTDDSHSFDDWNDDPPFDPDHYGITIMGSGEKFKRSAVERYVEERTRNIIAQIVKPGDEIDRAEKFTIDKPTRVRIYAIGEGQNRDMYDYGWIEERKTGNVVWEMTYSMTFHAGGGRKNRMVNTTILLERGDYSLHWKSDDSHSFGDWNVAPPEDQQYWGITLYRDEGIPSAPAPPGVPPPPHRIDED
jgi:hypothetical protein